MINAYYLTKRYGIIAEFDRIGSEARPAGISVRCRSLWRRHGA
jgi:hypothetical protein